MEQTSRAINGCKVLFRLPRKFPRDPKCIHPIGNPSKFTAKSIERLVFQRNGGCTVWLWKIGFTRFINTFSLSNILCEKVVRLSTRLYRNPDNITTPTMNVNPSISLYNGLLIYIFVYLINLRQITNLSSRSLHIHVQTGFSGLISRLYISKAVLL